MTEFNDEAGKELWILARLGAASEKYFTLNGIICDVENFSEEDEVCQGCRALEICRIRKEAKA